MSTVRSSTKGRRPVHIEVVRSRDLPPANPAPPARAQRDAHGRFVRGNTVGRAKRVRPATGALRGSAGLSHAHTDYAPFARWAVRYVARRLRELRHAHGDVSTGVETIVDSAGQTMAASRFLQWRASQTGDVDLFRQASQLAETARQHELAAWDLAAREATPRGPRNAREALNARIKRAT